jgi:hypothetical protein
MKVLTVLHVALSLLCILPIANATLSLSDTPDLNKHDAQAGEKPMSQAEAEAIVENREKAKAERRAEIQALIDSALVDEEFVHSEGERKVILKRVKPIGAFVAEKNTPTQQKKAVSRNFEAFEPTDYRIEHISMYTVVYNQSHSKITWRDHEHEEFSEFTIWTNIPLTYLRPLSSFEAEEVYYNYMGFVDSVDSEMELERANNYLFHGHKYKSRWKDSPVAFSDEPEYVVIAAGASAIPSKLYEQMDAVLSHYLEHEDSFKIQHENAETMNAAVKKYRTENPVKPTDKVMIMWPKKNSRYLK